MTPHQSRYGTAAANAASHDNGETSFGEPIMAKLPFSDDFGAQSKTALDLRREWDLNPRELALPRLFKGFGACGWNRLHPA